MRIAGIIPDSIVDGPGVRYVIFTQGCKHFCKGCHNKETWDLEGGQEKTIRQIVRDIRKHPNIKGVTLSGGEPFLQAKECSLLIDKINKKYEGLNFVIYTGYTFEELLQESDEDKLELLRKADILIDGKFVLEQKDLNFAFRGSRNQRVLDLAKSLEKQKAVEYLI